MLYKRVRPFQVYAIFLLCFVSWPPLHLNLLCPHSWEFVIEQCFLFSTIDDHNPLNVQIMVIKLNDSSLIRLSHNTTDDRTRFAPIRFL
ncbi:hypothetical protein RIF29_40405 [Crotalaria pallida]|uniref:Uncharacterized protein n=1 Tax=Crotalaria pallida TaxID=3830 RepID=A0AAN9E630_CROPI